MINNELLSQLRDKAIESEKLRQNFDLRTTPKDGSQRIFNVLEVGTHVPIHRHTKSSETVLCLEGCFDEAFFEELPNMVAGGPVHNGETALDESCFKEVARFHTCPREGAYGIQIPMIA